MIITGKVTKKQLRAIDYFARSLFSPQLSQHIQIKISYVKMDNFWGLVIVDDYNTRGQPRHFTIHIKKDLNERERLMTIAHEMVHVKQYAKLEINEEMTRWHGKPIDIKKISYLDHPWEIEAYDVGDRLFEEFVNDNYI